MFIGIVKILLLWWIVSTFLRWYRGAGPRGNTRRPVADEPAVSDLHDARFGTIVDADFEEMDGDTGKKR